MSKGFGFTHEDIAKVCQVLGGIKTIVPQSVSGFLGEKSYTHGTMLTPANVLWLVNRQDVDKTLAEVEYHNSFMDKIRGATDEQYLTDIYKFLCEQPTMEEVKDTNKSLWAKVAGFFKGKKGKVPAMRNANMFLNHLKAMTFIRKMQIEGQRQWLLLDHNSQMYLTAACANWNHGNKASALPVSVGYVLDDLESSQLTLSDLEKAIANKTVTPDRDT